MANRRKIANKGKIATKRKMAQNRRAQTALKIGDLAPKKGPGATREYRSAGIRADPGGSGGNRRDPADFFFSATGDGQIRRDPAEIFVHLGRRGKSGPENAMALS